MEPAARRSLKIQDAKCRQKSPSGHHHTTLSGYIFATKAHIDNRKKLVSSNISFTCSRNMVNFGPIAAEIGPVVWGNPANFNGFRVLAALGLLHGTLVLGVSQTLRRWTEAWRHLYSAGRPSRWALAYILVRLVLQFEENSGTELCPTLQWYYSSYV